jgi:hypothetical protein
LVDWKADWRVGWKAERMEMHWAVWWVERKADYWD